MSYGAFMITVTDVNEIPVIPSNQKFTVKEDVAVNTKVGTVIVTDPDAADVGQLAFKIEDNSGSSNGIVMFTIDQGKGGRYGEARISTAPTAVLNYERKSSYALRISASDTANHTATATVAVNLLDVNEAPVTKTGLAFTVSEHNDAILPCTKENFCVPGTEVGTVTAVDPDYVANSPESFTFAFAAGATGGGNLGNTFAIDATTGVITVSKVCLCTYFSLDSV